jgi:hypothetical protein
LHKARELPKDQFKHEVEKELTGLDSEPAEIIYFKFYKSQIPVIEQAIETASLMLGTDKSRGYCLEMICADFLAGANLDSGNSNVLLYSIRDCSGSHRRKEEKRFLITQPRKIRELPGTKAVTSAPEFRLVRLASQPSAPPGRLEMPIVRHDVQS